MRIFFLFLSVFILFACSGGAKSPEALIEELLSKRQKNLLTREAMLELSYGDLKDEIANMEDEDFDSYTSELGVTQGSYKILSSNCESETKCAVTYILTYRSDESGERVFTSEVRKVAQMENHEGIWLLTDMANIKTFHESLQPINPLIDEAE